MRNLVGNFKGIKGGRPKKKVENGVAVVEHGVVVPQKNKGGRPFGAKSKTTIEREEAFKAMQQRIFNYTDRLTNAQIVLAEGLVYVLRIDRVVKENGNVVENKAIIVTDPIEIAGVIDGSIKNDDKRYYKITAKDPDNAALDSLLNRAYGKPKETLEVQDATKLRLDF